MPSWDWASVIPTFWVFSPTTLPLPTTTMLTERARTASAADPIRSSRPPSREPASVIVSSGDGPPAISTTSPPRPTFSSPTGQPNRYSYCLTITVTTHRPTRPRICIIHWPVVVPFSCIRRSVHSRDICTVKVQTPLRLVSTAISPIGPRD